MNQNRPLPLNRITRYVMTHEASLGTLLAAYGAFYLAAVIMGGWTWADWGMDVFTFPHTAIQPVMPRGFISPIFFVTSLPAMLIGIALLCDYCVREIRFGLTVVGERVAILLTVFGFAYVVVGAWPLQAVVDMPWEWQKQIMGYGLGFAWGLYLLGLLVLAIGGVSLFLHSREYRRRHPEVSVGLA